MAEITTSAGAQADQAWELDARHPGPVSMLLDVWRYRRLLYFVGYRALKRIYRRTVLGWLWLLILPLAPLVLRTLVFGGLLNVPSDGVPYLLFIAGGSLCWDLLAIGLMWGARGLEMNRGVLDEAYVPSVTLTLGNITPALLDFALKLAAFLAIALAIAGLTGQMHLSADRLGWSVAALLLAFLLAVGLSLFASPWGEEGRDLRFALGQLLPIWYLLTPVLYPMSAMPETWHPWVRLNPMAPIVETFKWSLFGAGLHDPRAFGVAASVVGVVFVLGLTYYARVEAAAQDAR